MINKDKTYKHTFICVAGKDWPCKQEHPCELSQDEVYYHLSHKMIYGWGLTVTKELMDKTLENFDTFFEQEKINNFNEPFNHYMSVQIEAELIQSFMEKEFGTYPE